MKHLFVPYEIAVMAKDKGFNEPCFGYFDNKGDYYSIRGNNYASNSFLTNDLVAAPLHQQLVDWFREKHEIHISVCPFTCNKYDYDLQYDFLRENEVTELEPNFKSHYEALNAGILEAFKLI